MKKPMHPITDHAVLRFLERVYGVDIEAIRRGIGRRVDEAVEQGASGVHHCGFRYVIDNGTVITIHETCRPDRGKYRRRGR